MTVKKIFWQDPYQTQVDTIVMSVNGNHITLAETIFYAFAGGQERDYGTIAGYPVLDAHKEGLEIIYTLPDEHTLQVGDAVHVEIDWERRYALMRLHFAAEIVLEVVTQDYGIEKIGAHIAQDKSRIDFLHNESIKPLLPDITHRANQLIVANHPITSAFSHELSERRYWMIDGFAKVACGGTHPKTTGEVGKIRLKRKNTGKGKERIEIYLANVSV
ncbi:MAG: alanyl-tRNA editing protein [Chloroflexota bacterium]